MQSITVKGKTFTVGQTVGFKSDFEQTGTITKIERNSWGGYTLTLENPNGFGGEYLRYAKITKESANDCWTD
jgi:hypothetical protein